MSYKDRTWCASPNCKGICGRKMSDHDRTLAAALAQDTHTSYAYFCGYPKEFSMIDKVKAKLKND